MKRIFCLFLVLVAAVSMCACSFGNRSTLLEPVEFIYPRKSADFVYGTDQSIFDTEFREASGHREDLNYLLSMYLRGPQADHLRSPFPTGCTLESVSCEEETLHLILSREFVLLENTELTIACAALTKTCLSLADVQQVHIEATGYQKSINIILDADSLLLSDYSTFEAAPVTE